MKIKPFHTLEEEVLTLQQEAKYEALSIAEILRVLSGKGRLIILILLSLPFCLPIQIPGLSTPFGLLVSFMGLRMTFGKRIWLPEALLNKKVPNHLLNGILDKTLSVIRTMRPWIHPRMIWLCHSPFMEMAHGLIIFVLGIFLALPLPVPFSNLTAAWSIVLVALGVLEDDGLIVLIGCLMSFITFSYFLSLMLLIKQVF